MPRGEARIRVTIWDDEDYTSLPMDAQWLYEALLSQKTLNHAGVLTIPRREWSNLCSDDDAPERIKRARALLEQRRYVVVDDDTDELLVRSYIRRDVEAAPPGTFRSAMNAAIAVSSPRIKAVLHKELLRLDTTVVSSKGSANGEKPIDALYRALRELRPGPADPSTGPASDADPEPAETAEHAMRMPCATDAERSDAHAMADGMRCPHVEAEAEAEAEDLTYSTTQVDVQSVAHTHTRDGPREADPQSPPTAAPVTTVEVPPTFDTHRPHPDDQPTDDGAVPTGGPEVRPLAWRPPRRRDPYARAAALNRSARGVRADRLVEAWADRCRFRPPEDVRRGLYPRVDELCGLGWTDEVIIEALDAWSSKSLGVHLFSQVAAEVANAQAAALTPRTRPNSATSKIARLQALKDPADTPAPPARTALPPATAVLRALTGDETA